MPRSRRAPRSTMEGRGGARRPRGRDSLSRARQWCQRQPRHSTCGCHRAAGPIRPNHPVGRNGWSTAAHLSPRERHGRCRRDERDPWPRAQAKDEIAGRDICGLDHTLEQLLPDGAPTVLDVLDQSSMRILYVVRRVYDPGSNAGELMHIRVLAIQQWKVHCVT